MRSLDGESCADLGKDLMILHQENEPELESHSLVYFCHNIIITRVLFCFKKNVIQIRCCFKMVVEQF